MKVVYKTREQIWSLIYSHTFTMTNDTFYSNKFKNRMNPKPGYPFQTHLVHFPFFCISFLLLHSCNVNFTFLLSSWSCRHLPNSANAVFSSRVVLHWKIVILKLGESQSWALRRPVEISHCFSAIDIVFKDQEIWQPCCAADGSCLQENSKSID